MGKELMGGKSSGRDSAGGGTRTRKGVIPEVFEESRRLFRLVQIRPNSFAFLVFRPLPCSNLFILAHIRPHQSVLESVLTPTARNRGPWHKYGHKKAAPEGAANSSSYVVRREE